MAWEENSRICLHMQLIAILSRIGVIMLNELDKELERRGLPFVRYADDSMIFCKSKRAAMRVKDSITRFTAVPFRNLPVRIDTAYSNRLALSWEQSC